MAYVDRVIDARARHCSTGLFGVALGTQLGAVAQTVVPRLPDALTNAAQLRALSPAEAARRRPVRLRGVVTAQNPDRSVFVQDDTGGSFLTKIPPGLRPLQPGDDIFVEGVTFPGLFLTGILTTTARKVGRAELPLPVPVTYDDLLSGGRHYERVELVGIIRSGRWQPARQCPILTLAVGARKLDLEIVVPGVTNVPPLVDARVRVAGLACGRINPRRQLRSPELLVSRLEDLRVEVPPPTDAFAAPLATAVSLLSFNPAGESGHRVRVRGIVTHQQLGEAFFLRDGPDGLMVRTTQRAALTPGEIVEVAGFPAMGRFGAFLEDAEFTPSGTRRLLSRCPVPSAKSRKAPTTPTSSPSKPNSSTSSAAILSPFWW